MKFNDVKLLLPASGFMKTSDDNGRTVIDEIRDGSYERNHQIFAGADRPELHKTLDGFHQVSVEKESTNLFLNSDSLSTQGVSVTADPYTVSFEGTGKITFSGAHTGELEGAEGKRVSATFTPTSGTLTCTVDGEVSKAQIEQSQYATLYIPTQGTPVTRLAPSPVIENALPETGTVAGVVDMVVDESNSWMWAITSGATNERSRVHLFGKDIRFQIFGAGLSTVTPAGLSTIDFNERVKIAHLLTYNDDTAKLAVMIGNQIEIFSTSLGTTGKSVRSVYVGDYWLTGLQRANRFEKPIHKDSIVRVNATDEEIKQFFETLTAGTSMATKTENMTIV